LAPIPFTFGKNAVEIAKLDVGGGGTGLEGLVTITTAVGPDSCPIAMSPPAIGSVRFTSTPAVCFAQTAVVRDGVANRAKDPAKPA
jgi:hypothetical protein